MFTPPPTPQPVIIIIIIFSVMIPYCEFDMHSHDEQYIDIQSSNILIPNTKSVVSKWIFSIWGYPFRAPKMFYDIDS